MLSLIFITLCMLGNFSCFFVVCCLFNLSKLTFSKNSFSMFGNTITVSNSLDSGQDRHSVGPDLHPNCLQRLSTPLAWKDLKQKSMLKIPSKEYISHVIRNFAVK